MAEQSATGRREPLQLDFDLDLLDGHLDDQLGDRVGSDDASAARPASATGSVATSTPRCSSRRERVRARRRSLVERIVNLVEDGVDITAIAAITFTEKAAAELRTRVRAQLGIADEPSAATAALDRLDHAPIGTLHAFARRLLFDFPIEAGPASRVHRARRAGERPGVRGTVGRPARPPARRSRTAGRAHRRWAGLRRALRVRPVRRAHRRPADRPGFPRQLGPRRRPGRPRRPRSARGRRDHPPGPRRRRSPPPTSHPATRRWPRSPPSLRSASRLRAAASLRVTLETILAANDEFADKTSGCRAARRRGRSTSAVGRVGTRGSAQPRIRVRYRGQAPARRRRDTIGASCSARSSVGSCSTAPTNGRSPGDSSSTTCSCSPAVSSRNAADIRRLLHARYQRIMLDEFQDTDPIQLEIAVRLASRPDDPAHDTDWRQLVPEPGRLFIVGDPKQSIYRFRRADIAQYLRAADQVGADQVTLTANFRSTTAVIDFVNDVFGRSSPTNPTSSRRSAPSTPAAAPTCSATARSTSSVRRSPTRDRSSRPPAGPPVIPPTSATPRWGPPTRCG